MEEIEYLSKITLEELEEFETTQIIAEIET
jgi:hypothetical protein